MIIGIPKEIKNEEHRVGATPEMVRELKASGHKVIMQAQGGEGIGASDASYKAAGAKISKSAEEIFGAADMIIKVKEPQKRECKMLRPGQVLFTYLHLAPDPEQAKGLAKSKAVCIAYETITSPRGDLPLLTPMSQIAGRLSIQAAAICLQNNYGGKGVLLGGVAGVLPARVVILGGGVVGRNAARMAIGFGSDVTVIDQSPYVLEQLMTEMGSKIKTLSSNTANIETSVNDADVVVGGVLIPGAAAPKLVKKRMVKAMKPGSVAIDVCIDQGGCFETAEITTHAKPTYMKYGVVHYCVGNMPGVVPRSSTYALTNATAPYVSQIAKLGWKKALGQDSHLLNGLNVCDGMITHREVAKSLRTTYHDPLHALKAAA